MIFNKEKWKFIENGYGPDNGLDSTEMETFKKDPIGSLARETCQNSVDAQRGESPSLIEFKEFELKVADIPGKNDLIAEIKACRDSNASTSKLYAQFDEMLNYLKKNTIPCLRISDYNTKGLEAVKSFDPEKAFYRLTKGNGRTTKENGINGGSKGIGKFASFVNSQINTVFFSTLNEADEKGYMGITKLASRPLQDQWLFTNGYGYYSRSEKALPILDDLVLDKSFKRTEIGTDIYILGFKKEKTWKKDIIAKVLDSFICAIWAEKLEVRVDDVIITKETLESIVYDTKYVDKERDKRKIISQYLLLTSSLTQKKTFEIEGYGTFDIYLKEFTREQEKFATKKCAMVRYPYMKIKDLNVSCAIPCSALCIIHENDLNRELINIENPQHTDWEPLRLEPTERRKMRKILNELEAIISRYANDCLLSGQNKEVDMEGAGDLLPDIDDFGDTEISSTENQPTASRIINILENKVKNNYGEIDNDDALSVVPDIGSHTEDDTEDLSPIPIGANSSSGGNSHDADTETGFSEEGNDVILREVHLTGLNPRAFLIDKKVGKYIIRFRSIYDEDNCCLELYYRDDSNIKYKASISSCTIDGVDVQTEDGKAVKFKIEKEKEHTIEVCTDVRDILGSEVKIYAFR